MNNRPSSPLSTVSLILCTHSVERLDQVHHAVTSVLGGTHQPDEFFIVVDANKELHDTLQGTLPEAISVLHSHGRGACQARNTALAKATGDLIVCLDDDAWVEASWLAELTSAFDDPTIYGAGSLDQPEWENPTRTFPPELYWLVGATYAGHPTHAGPITRPIGAAMAARREAVLAIGGFSPEFGANTATKGSYNEELVMYTAIRHRYGNDCTRYVPTAIVHHFAPSARTTWKHLQRRSLVEGRSKADARRLYGADVLRHDRNYIRTTLLPAIARYTRQALTEHDKHAARAAIELTAAFALTGTAYAKRRIRHIARPARRTGPIPQAQRDN
jgi:glycosyltransferase involved in cell wall biosynthesis